MRPNTRNTTKHPRSVAATTRLRSGMMRTAIRSTAVLVVSAGSTAAMASGAQAASVGLGTADPFVVLGGSTITNTGPSVLTGDVGLAPGPAITGFRTVTLTGTTHVNDAVAIGAKSALTTAYDDAAGRPSTATVRGDLAGRTLAAGVYTSASSLGLTGELVLDGQNDPNSVFVFQAGSTLTAASASRVRLIRGAQACNVFWQVGSSATIGTGSVFVGNIMALSSISLTTGVTLDGRAMARNGAVTLDTDTIIRSACTTTTGGTTGAGTATGGSSGSTSDGGTASSGTPGGSAGTDGSTDGGTTTPDAAAPTATTLPATSVGSTTAVVGGTVQAPTEPSTYTFEYGTTRKYGRQTKRGPSTSDRAKRVRRTLRGLRPGRLYYYRVVVVGPRGAKTYGRSRTLRTRPSTPARLARRPSGFAG